MPEIIGIRFNPAPNSGTKVVIPVKAHNCVGPVRIAKKEIFVFRWDLIAFKSLLDSSIAVETSVILETSGQHGHNESNEYNLTNLDHRLFCRNHRIAFHWLYLFLQPFALPVIGFQQNIKDAYLQSVKAPNLEIIRPEDLSMQPSAFRYPLSVIRSIPAKENLHGADNIF